MRVCTHLAAPQQHPVLGEPVQRKAGEVQRHENVGHAPPGVAELVQGGRAAPGATDRGWLCGEQGPANRRALCLHASLGGCCCLPRRSSAVRGRAVWDWGGCGRERKGRCSAVRSSGQPCAASQRLRRPQLQPPQLPRYMVVQQAVRGPAPMARAVSERRVPASHRSAARCSSPAGRHLWALPDPRLIALIRNAAMSAPPAGLRCSQRMLGCKCWPTGRWLSVRGVGRFKDLSSSGQECCWGYWCICLVAHGGMRQGARHLQG